MDIIFGFVWLLLTVIGTVGFIKLCCVIAQKSDPPAQSGTARKTSSSSGGSVIYFANNPHGLRDKEYRFNYVRAYDPKHNKSCWRAYITKMPGLNGRDPDLHKTHRLTDGNGTYWVCWNSAVDTLEGMQNISRVWADSIQEYIATGKTFG